MEEVLIVVALHLCCYSLAMAKILKTVTAIISLVELTSTAVQYLKAIKDVPKEC